MKIKNELFENELKNKALNKFIKNDLPIKQSYAINKFIKEIWDKSKSYWDVKLLLLSKYWEEKEKWFFNVKKENLKEFNEKFKELLEIEEDYQYEKITISLDSDLKISPEDMSLLEEFINFE